LLKLLLGAKKLLRLKVFDSVKTVDSV
jgi:hypothetical protein